MFYCYQERDKDGIPDMYKELKPQIMSKPLISPSLLSANFANLQADIDMINRSEADWLHLDIMDGVFVPVSYTHLTLPTKLEV